MITREQFGEAVDSRSREPIFEKMQKVRVGIAGLGGLGSNIAAALVRSGIGALTLADHDTVELSNINRQLYTPADIGMKKTDAVRKILCGISPCCEIDTHFIRVTAENAVSLFGNCDMIIEAFDGAEDKAMFISTIMSEINDVPVISGSGMAGFGKANDIVTRQIGQRLTVCGDGVTDVTDGDGLTAARVMICAGHMASRAVEMILKGEV